MTECTGNIHDGIYNCFGRYDDSLCSDCVHNAKSEAKEKQERFISQRDRIDELYKFLKGEELPEGIYCKMPKLLPKMAFTVIWFLQEHLHVLPDNIEQCDGCKELFDADGEGFHLNENYKNNKTGKAIAKKHWGDWCDSCILDVYFEVK